MTPPRNGPTVYAHVVQSLERAETDFFAVKYRIQTSKRLSKQDRIALSRKMAGVVSEVESVRLWLEGGAPK